MKTNYCLNNNNEQPIIPSQIFLFRANDIFAYVIFKLQYVCTWLYSFFLITKD